MSRTYRRRKGEKPSSWITHEYICVDEYTRKDKVILISWIRGLWKDIPRTGNDLKKHLAIYHADGYSHMNHVPSWFVNQYFTRKDRAKERQELKRIMKRGGEYDDYSFRPYRRGALWEWW